MAWSIVKTNSDAFSLFSFSLETARELRTANLCSYWIEAVEIESVALIASEVAAILLSLVAPV